MKKLIITMILFLSITNIMLAQDLAEENSKLYSMTETKEKTAHSQDEEKDKKEKKSTIVFVCSSKSAKTYHKSSNCRGLNRCKSGISKVDIKNVGSKSPCKICY